MDYETGCVTCVYLRGLIISGMLPVIKTGNFAGQPPPLCLDIRQKPASVQGIDSLLVPAGNTVQYAMVGGAGYTTLVGPHTLSGLTGNRYNFVSLHSVLI